MRIGRDTGFNSGASLDHVYRDRAEGLGPIGRLADWWYLDAPGWRGIRRRKVHLEELLRLAMDRLRAEGMPVRVLDIAAGHGRYVLDAVAAGGAPPGRDRAARDVDPRHVAAGTALVRERGLGTIARVRARLLEPSIATRSPRSSRIRRSRSFPDSRALPRHIYIG